MPPRDQTVLVLGATGRQGAAVMSHLRERGWKLRVLTPEPDGDAARAMHAQGAEIVRGDLNDKRQIELAVAGVYGVFSVQSSADDDSDEIAQAKRLINAARQAGCKHLVHASAAGVDRDSGLPHLNAKLVVEKYLRDRDLPATIVRPVYFMEHLWDKALSPGANWSMLKDVLGERTRLQMIACDDIGAFVALAFEDPRRYLGATVELAGDELSFTEAAETYRRVFGRRPPRLPLGGAILKLRARELYRELAWFREPRFTADIAALRAALPSLKTLEQFFLVKKTAGAST